MNSRSVLIVEDSPHDSATFRRYLTHARDRAYRVLEASSGAEAFECLKHITPDCLLIDFHLPDMDGLEFLSALHNEADVPRFPIIVVTGDDNATLAVQAIQAGACDYLIKDTITEATIGRSVDNAIEKYLLYRQVEAQREELAAQHEELERRNTALAAANHALQEEITAGKHAEEARRESEQRYADMVANVPGMIFRSRRKADDTRKFLYVSEGSLDLFGLAPDAFYADALRLRKMVHPDDIPSYEKAALLAFEEQQPWNWQGRIVLPSGEIKSIQGRGRLTPQSNGDLLWNGLLMDVTESVQAQEKAAQLAAIVEGSVDAILSTTLDGRVISWNRAAEHLYGYSEREMLGQPVQRLWPSGQFNTADDLLERILRDEVVQSFETMRMSKDGTLLDISMTLSPIKDRQGHIVGTSAIVQDIRQRKAAEARLQKQMLRIEALRNIDRTITASLDLRVTLNVLLDQVTTHLNVDSAAVLLLNPHTHRLEYTAGRGFRTKGVTRTYLRLGEGFAGRAALERRVINVPSLKEVGNEFRRDSLIVGEDFVSYWAVPLITKGRVEGVLEIFHRAPQIGDTDWIGFLETLAGQAAIAIENASLFNDLQRSNVDLQIAYDTTLEGWSKALDLRDKETEGHTLRVTEGTMTLAHAMNVPDEILAQMRRGALLHDIGKMGIPDSILLKPGALSAEEWVVMKKHPDYAHDLLSPIPFLRPALDIPYCHHEKWDGSGYPRGLKGEEIPLSARIFAVVDVWDALRSDRPYRAGWSVEKVRDHIAAGSGTHFDPRVVEVFLNTEM